MFGYEIVFPPAAQLELRRKQLNDAGFQAWLSPILLLATIFVGRFLLSKPNLAVGKAVSKPPTALQSVFRRIRWTLNTTDIPEFGPLHVQLIGALYLSWLLFLIFRNTGHDYLHLTKAFGHVAISQLPFQYLLAFKTPRSPITLATGLTHERLNAYHRLFGRIVHGLLGMHAVLYLNFFVVKELLAKRIRDRDVRLGILAFSLLNLLGLLTLPLIRQKAYHKLFYRSHIFITALIPVVLFFHVPYTRRYVLQAGVFWLANGLFRARASEKTIFKSEAIKGTGLIKVKVNLDKMSPMVGWIPGQHVYLRRGFLGPRNPFTIVQVMQQPEESKVQMMLVARDLRGPQTGSLGNLATVDKSEVISIEGPYGEAGEYLPELLEQGKNAGQIYFVAGGVGATYSLPIYLQALKARDDTSGMKLVWFVKSQDDAQWGISMLLQVPQRVDVDIYITQKLQTPSVKVPSINGVNIHDVGSRPDLTTVLAPIMAPKSDRSTDSSLLSSHKRDPRKVKKNYEKLTVLICGPPGLSHNVRREVGKHATGYGREVAWFEEQFGFGGS